MSLPLHSNRSHNMTSAIAAPTQELSLERVLDVYDVLRARPGWDVAGVVVSMGGQMPNNLALALHRAGAATRP